jgi:hypothetical protein
LTSVISGIQRDWSHAGPTGGVGVGGEYEDGFIDGIEADDEGSGPIDGKEEGIVETTEVGGNEGTDMTEGG